MSDPHGDGVPGRRAHQGLLKTIRPSREAAELASLLRRTYDWSALQSACHPDRHFVRYAEINRRVKSELKKHKRLSGPKRETMRCEMRKTLISEAKRTQELLRRMAWDLYALVQLYDKHRERIQAAPVNQRPAKARELVTAYMSRDGKALQRLDGLTDQQIETRRASQAAKQRAQFIAMMLAQEGLKLPRRPVIRMLFPQSAANPLRAIEEFRRDVAAHWQEAVRKHPDLGNMAPHEAAAIVLSNTRFLRMDEKMWHSRKAAFTKSHTERKD